MLGAAAREEAGKKEHKHSRPGREHPPCHWREACRVQHTRMPAYCTRYLSHTYTGEAGQTYLRLLHLVLGIHLCDDFVHVGLQDHPTHHHLRQNVVDLRKTRCFNSSKQSNFPLTLKTYSDLKKQIVIRKNKKLKKTFYSTRQVVRQV